MHLLCKYRAKDYNMLILFFLTKMQVKICWVIG
jgi:hypothetical protein